MVDKETIQHVIEAKESLSARGGKIYHIITMKSVNKIARNSGMPTKEIEVTALEQGIVPQRYLRNIGTIGFEGQIKLLRSVVAIAGAGGARRRSN